MIKRRSPGLDGLRGIAVASVVIGHAWPNLLPGGFTGVDMFFVLSGFLITTQLFAEHHDYGSISIGKFYARRIKRIFPASLLVIAVTGVLWALLFGPGLAQEVLTALSAAAASVSNIYFRLATLDYFNAGSGASPILHYWSLGVEEQFYLVYPILLIGIQRVSGGRSSFRSFLNLTGMALAAVTAVSFATMVLSTQNSAFYLPWFRAWELSAGGLLAYWFASRQGAPWLIMPRARNAMIAIGSAGLVISFAYAGSFSRWPGFETTIPVATTCLLVFALFSSGSAQTIFSISPLRFLGRISFALYLWHWVLLGLVDSLVLPESRSDAQTAVTVGAALLIASASTLFLEEPLRDVRIDTTRRIRTALVGGVGAAILTLAGVSFGVPILASVAGGNSPLAVSLSEVRDDFEYLRSEPAYFTTTEAYQENYVPCEYGAAVDASGQPNCKNTTLPKIILLGDSHALSWFPPLNQWAAENSYALVVLGRSACSPFNVVATSADGSTACTKWANEVWVRIAKMKPDLLVVATSGYSKIAVGELYSSPGTGDRDWMPTAISILAQVRSQATRVLLIGDVPRAAVSVPDCMAVHRFGPEECARPIAEAISESFRLNQEEVAAASGIDLWDPSGLICPDGTCAWLKDDVIMYRDSHHLSAKFAASLKAPLGRVLSQILLDSSPQ